MNYLQRYGNIRDISGNTMNVFVIDINIQSYITLSEEVSVENAPQVSSTLLRTMP